jgi:sec-independent protein translocase protein TatA
MANIGFAELIVILLLLTLVFGGSRLPALGESIGKTIRSFKRGMASDDRIEVAKVDVAKIDVAKVERASASKGAREGGDATDADVVDVADATDEKKG